MDADSVRALSAPSGQGKGAQGMKRRHPRAASQVLKETNVPPSFLPTQRPLEEPASGLLPPLPELEEH